MGERALYKGRDALPQERMRARIQARLAEIGSCAEWPASVPIDDLER
jgi:hypothetical protein